MSEREEIYMVTDLKNNNCIPMHFRTVVEAYEYYDSRFHDELLTQWSIVKRVISGDRYYDEVILTREQTDAIDSE